MKRFAKIRPSFLNAKTREPCSSSAWSLEDLDAVRELKNPKTSGFHAYMVGVRQGPHDVAFLLLRDVYLKLVVKSHVLGKAHELQ